MINSLLLRVKNRLSRTIDRRISQELERERKMITEVAQSMTDISVTFSDHIQSLAKSIEVLEERIKGLEKILK